MSLRGRALAIAIPPFQRTGARGDGSVHGQPAELTPGILRHFTFRTCAGVRGGERASHRPKGVDGELSHLFALPQRAK